MKVLSALVGVLAVALSVPALAFAHHSSLPGWWLRQAACIHRHEAPNWHERSNATYRGGLQFSYSTWARAGGRGDPADASAGEQLRRAYRVWRRDGGSWREWPNTARACGLL